MQAAKQAPSIILLDELDGLALLHCCRVGGSALAYVV